MQDDVGGGTLGTLCRRGRHAASTTGNAGMHSLARSHARLRKMCLGLEKFRDGCSRRSGLYLVPSAEPKPRLLVGA
jgi:hypothetical protein